MELLKKIAEEFDGMKYFEEPSMEFVQYMKENNIVMIWGFSDDNVEARGAIDGEYVGFLGTDLYVNKEEIIDPREYDSNCESCELLKKHLAPCKKIVAKYGEDEVYCWTFETDIPHECFDVLDHPINDEQLFCRGIVFSLDNLEKEDEPK